MKFEKFHLLTISLASPKNINIQTTFELFYPADQ